ncbi:DUF3073 domain-containing protein [Actinomycetaceae bacterium TAE3-ERU4]|nr:DUF3073 domain-containing protein [Actinomycetaceae bacterium TAE3-ERU4]
MGRGRQRAKEKKVARRLKYYTPETDYAALQRELSGSSKNESTDDPYADIAAQYNSEFADEDEDDFADGWDTAR